MPRSARIKLSNGIYHIMARSISEVSLFRCDRDKNVYLKYVKKYKAAFSFKVYAYCLMSNHVHFLIDSNGSDISKFMHCINQCYSQYFNRKYNRHGHLFGDRFKSKLANTDDSVINISAYIHNNPKDIKGYLNCVENYKYSSFGIYLGKFKDIFSILDKDFILNYFKNDPFQSLSRYKSFVKSRIGINEKIDLNSIPKDYEPHSEYKSYKKTLVRDFSPKEIVEFVSKNYSFDKQHLNIKFKRTSSIFKSICVFLMRNLCDMKLVDMTSVINNLTLSSLSQLSDKGYKLVTDNSKYISAIDDFIKWNESSLNKPCPNP
ncbi:transposase IS200 like protein [Clostridium homopropionicum DSM 5847]|uniref:Transposase IS200 like protein n=1 Tax=Clostridium homopropionicum DSM 5847 TaxID=1121318 RepID=A0A0L6Z8V0_9CLOT|nr:transposase [Clostridium homopropionicum]KOA19395.1 transposase IS200 like protein [Clostridium homopropionicum DSM 5847]SFG68465.1 REP element-mobilizing transposase RayT [Clostridium homopropionicum]